MQRRSFVKLLALGGLFPAVPALGITRLKTVSAGEKDSHGIISPDDYLQKMRHPNELHDGDVTMGFDEQRIVNQLVARLSQVQNVVGHGNFSVLSFDQMLRYARNYSQVGKFENAETEFLEKLFYEDAVDYGFFGDKPLTNITESIERRAIEKVPYTGQYLFKGESMALYTKIKRDIGDSITLTSGVRSVVKQMQLFLRKVSRYEGNFSLASRSLAPPGYSFHGIGDFDVGHIGLGESNFTNQFARTEEFKKLLDLGYINIRYPLDNELGVRFEPWHIKVV